MHDLLVIGAGLSGLSAALTAAQAGLRVGVVAKGIGALHWSAGTIELLGYTASGQPVDQPLTEIENLDRSHPYNTVGSQGVQESLAWFRKEVALGGAEYNGPAKDDANVWLPSPVGAKRPVYLVPEAQIAGNLSQGDPILVVGLQGMRDFYPDLIASNLNKQGFTARAVHIPVETITDRTDFNTVQLAKALDQPETRRRLGEKLTNLVDRDERIGLPAVLGMVNHIETLADLRRISGADVFEIPTLPPSVPGIRLHQALCRRLESLGVRVEIGMDVIGYHAEQGVIRWVETETSSRPLRHRATAYLLATGGVLGGGFTGDIGGRFWEIVFDIPLTAPANRSGWFRSEFLDPRGQPIFQAGVEVNDEFRPVDASGEVVYKNLLAAGGLLAHADAIRERSLEGIAITTGRNAALALVSETSKNLAST